MAEHILSAEPTHSRWNRALPPRRAIAPGETVHMECVDASGAQARPGMSVADYSHHRSRANSRADRADFCGRRRAGRCVANRGIEGRGQGLGLDDCDPGPRLSEGAIFRAG